MEVVAAIAILGLVAVSAMATSSSILSSATLARQNVEASVIANGILTEQELLAATANSGTGIPPASGNVAGHWADYAWSAATSPVAGEYAIWEIAIQVTWPAGAKSLQSRVFRP
jgi:type II secretory pathway pseudopilin PulG